jgi:hypothetical protein
MNYDTNVCFLINTYNRHESLLTLVKSIHNIDRKLPIYIVDDGSNPPIQDYSKKLKYNPHIKIYYQGNKGKEFYWQTCNYLFDWVRDAHYKYYYMLPDDVVVAEDFLEKTRDKWNEIRGEDSNITILNLITDRVGLKCWTDFKPEDKGYAYLTNWVDMCMMFDRKFFTHIIKIPHIKRDWDKRPMLGSGVGSYLSRMIFWRKGTLYQVKESMVEFQPSHKLSVMNPKIEDTDE